MSGAVPLFPLFTFILSERTTLIPSFSARKRLEVFPNQSFGTYIFGIKDGRSKLRFHFRDLRKTPNAARWGVVRLSVRWERTVFLPLGVFLLVLFCQPLMRQSPWRIRQVYGPLCGVYFFLLRAGDSLDSECLQTQSRLCRRLSNTVRLINSVTVCLAQSIRLTEGGSCKLRGCWFYLRFAWSRGASVVAFSSDVSMAVRHLMEQIYTADWMQQWSFC